MGDVLTMNVVVDRHLRGERNNKLTARLITKMAFVSELSRMVRDTVKDPLEREGYYMKIIEAMDYSDEWHEKIEKLKLNVLMKDLQAGRIKDLPATKKSVVINGEVKGVGEKDGDVSDIA